MYPSLREGMVDPVLGGWVQQMRDEIGRVPWRMDPDRLGDHRIFRFIQKMSLEGDEPPLL